MAFCALAIWSSFFTIFVFSASWRRSRFGGKPSAFIFLHDAVGIKCIGRRAYRRVEVEPEKYPMRKMIYADDLITGRIIKQLDTCPISFMVADVVLVRVVVTTELPVLYFVIDSPGV